MSEQLDNLNVAAIDDIPSPAEVRARLPLSEAAASTVLSKSRARMSTPIRLNGCTATLRAATA